MKALTFSSPVDASYYLAGFGPASGAMLRRINYETGELRFSLVDADGVTAAEVNAINVEAPTEDNAAESIRAAIAATIPA